jgi:hypothetical protein
MGQEQGHKILVQSVAIDMSLVFILDVPNVGRNG